MAVAYDTGASGEGTSVSSKTISITVANNANRVLLVFLQNGDTTNVSGVTFDGVAMTSVYNFTSGATQRQACYRLIAPNAVTGNVVVTLAATTNRISVVAGSFYNVDQTTPLGTAQTVTGTNNTLHVACGGGVSGDMAVGFGARETTGAASPTLTNYNGIPKYHQSGALSTSAAVTSRTPALPATQHLGMLMIAHCASENNDTHSCATTGWNSLVQTNSGSGWTVSFWWAIYDGTTADPVITWTNSSDGSARVHSFHDTKPTGTPLALLGTVGTGTTSTHTSTGGNTTADDSLAIYIDHCANNTGMVAETGWTERVDSGSATGPVRTYVATQEIATSGTGSGNVSETGGNAAWVQQQIEAFNADVGDQTERVGFAHTGGLEIMSLATEPADTYNAFGWTGAGGTVDSTSCGAFVLKAASSEITGALDATLGALTLSSAGAVATDGSLDKSLGAATLAAAGTTALTGALDATLGVATLSSAGTVAVDGSLSATLGAATIEGVGAVAIDGSASPTLGSLALSGAGSVLIDGALDATLGALTLTASEQTTIIGSLSITLDAVTLEGVGAVAVTGGLATSLDALVLTAEGVAEGVTPEPVASTAQAGGGPVGRLYRGKYRKDIRNALRRAMKDLSDVRSSRSRKRKVRRIAREIAETMAFEAPAVGVVSLPGIAVLEPIRLQLVQLSLSIREAELAGEQARAKAEEMSRLFEAYEAEVQRIEANEEEEAIAMILALAA